MLNRDPVKAKAIAAAFPDVRVVQGSLDDAALIAREARRADIILRTFEHVLMACQSLTNFAFSPDLADTNHLQSVQAIHNALLSNRESTPPG